MASSHISSTTASSTTKPALSRLQAQLSQLELRENAINKRLEELRFKVPVVTNNLKQLDQFRTHLEPHVLAAHSLNAELLAPAAATASRVSGSVKALDDEQSRVQSVLRIVEQVIELKTCILGLASCMAANESEEAAEFVSRARKIPTDIIDCQFANETVPTPESPHPPKITLERAAEKLCGLFLQEFEHAAATNDGDKVTTYFKLFPLIGKEDVGLGAYSKYVCTGVSQRARDLIGSERIGMFYAAVLARMLEYVAGLIGVHAPLVGQHYGFGMMGKVVYKMQTEIDVQGGIVLDMFQDDKAINRKVVSSNPNSTILTVV
jgi:conserved oligomeric Golgi complex subunit 4